MKRFLIGLLIPSFVWAGCPNAIHLLPNSPNDDCERVGLSVPIAQQMQELSEKAPIWQAIIAEKSNLIDDTKASLAACKEEKTQLKTDDLRERKMVDTLQERGKRDFWIGMGAGALLILLSSWVVKQTTK